MQRDPLPLVLCSFYSVVTHAGGKKQPVFWFCFYLSVYCCWHAGLFGFFFFLRTDIKGSANEPEIKFCFSLGCTVDTCMDRSLFSPALTFTHLSVVVTYHRSIDRTAAWSMSIHCVPLLNSNLGFFPILYSYVAPSVYAVLA